MFPFATLFFFHLLLLLLFPLSSQQQQFQQQQQQHFQQFQKEEEVFEAHNYSTNCFRRPPINETKAEFILIHVGKAGGTTLVNALSPLFNFVSDYHLCSPSLSDVKGRPVLITTRDPISRTLSIWRWRKYKCAIRPTCFGSPRGLFECFPFLNDFLIARGNLPRNNTENSPPLSHRCLQFALSPLVASNHWQCDHRWHLRKFDDNFINTNVFPVRQSNLKDDFYYFCRYYKFDRRKCFKAKIALSVRHSNMDYPTVPKDYYLSDEARKYLEFELKEEIEMYNRLVDIVDKKIQTILPQLEADQRIVEEERLRVEAEKKKKEEERLKKEEEKQRKEEEKRKKEEEKKTKEEQRKIQNEIKMRKEAEKLRKLGLSPIEIQQMQSKQLQQIQREENFQKRKEESLLKRMEREVMKKKEKRVVTHEELEKKLGHSKQLVASLGRIGKKVNKI